MSWLERFTQWVLDVGLCVGVGAVIGLVIIQVLSRFLGVGI
jgi:hypothetical protein